MHAIVSERISNSHRKVLTVIALLCLTDAAAPYVLGQVAAQSSGAVKLPMAERMLLAAPAMTESIIVVGPWKPTLKEKEKPQVVQNNGNVIYSEPRYSGPYVGAVTLADSLDTHLYCCCTGLFETELRLQAFYCTQEVERAVWAFRAKPFGEFDVPKASPAEGCQMILFKNELPVAIRDAIRTSAIKVRGFPVLRSSNAKKRRITRLGEPAGSAPSGEKATENGKEDTPFKAVFASPAPRLLIAATSDELLSEVLQSITSPTIPEARFKIPQRARPAEGNWWAFRRFDLADPFHAETQQPGVQPKLAELDIRPNNKATRVLVRLISNESGSTEFFSAIVKPQEKDQPRRIDDKTVELSLELNDGDTLLRVLMLMGILVFL